MTPLKLTLLAIALFVMGTVLGYIFRAEVFGWFYQATGPVKFMTYSPLESIRASMKLALGSGVLWCSPVVGLLLAGPRRTWMLGVLFLALAVTVLLAVAWMVTRDIRTMAEAAPFGIESGMFFSAIPILRILLSGPAVVWVVATILRGLGRRVEP